MKTKRESGILERIRQENKPERRPPGSFPAGAFFKLLKLGKPLAFWIDLTYNENGLWEIFTFNRL